MRWMSRPVVVFSALCMLAIALGYPLIWADEQADATPPARQTLVAISKATTSITEPLRADGYPDYIAALNKVTSEGVTADNNAAIPLMRAFGPSILEESMRQPFFAKLGIADLPDEGDYLTGFEVFRDELLAKRADDEDKQASGFQERDRLDDAYAEALERPWAADEFPEVAAWLQANQEPLRLVTTAAKRPRYYAPLISVGTGDETGTMIMVLLPVLQELREAARLLKARSLLHIHNGDLEAAWDDLFACHRLGRLAAQDPTLIGALVGIAIDSVAITGDTFLAAEPRLSEPLARRILADLQTLGPVTSMAEKLDTGERFMFLDSVCAVASGRMGFSDLTGNGSAEGMSWVARLAASVFVDWNVSLKMGNVWYDRIVAAAKLPKHAERAAAYDEINRKIQKMSAEVRDGKTALYGLLAPRAVISQQLGNVFVSLLLPAVSAAQDAQDRSTTLTTLNEVSFAVAAHRAKTGSYPATLEQVEKETGLRLPHDPFTGKGFRFRREGDGYVVYSLGSNLRDDGGKVYYLDEGDDGRRVPKEEWDDFRIRVPPEAP